MSRLVTLRNELEQMIISQRYTYAEVVDKSQQLDKHIMVQMKKINKKRFNKIKKCEISLKIFK